jgi:hypothetical protein
MELDGENIFEFNGEWKLAKYPPTVDGCYMTIRCGLSGIYTHLDEWKDGSWQIGITDASDVIAYSRQLISKEDVEKMCREKLEKLKNSFTIMYK